MGALKPIKKVPIGDTEKFTEEFLVENHIQQCLFPDGHMLADESWLLLERTLTAKLGNHANARHPVILRCSKQVQKCAVVPHCAINFPLDTTTKENPLICSSKTLIHEHGSLVAPAFLPRTCRTTTRDKVLSLLSTKSSFCTNIPIKTIPAIPFISSSEEES